VVIRNHLPLARNTELTNGGKWWVRYKKKSVGPETGIVVASVGRQKGHTALTDYVGVVMLGEMNV